MQIYIIYVLMLNTYKFPAVRNMNLLEIGRQFRKNIIWIENNYNALGQDREELGCSSYSTALDLV